MLPSLKNPRSFSKTHVPKIFFGLIFALSQIGSLHANALAKTGITEETVLDHCNCFVKGTLVKTATGMVPIERIKVGDLVLSLNEQTGSLAYNRVTHLMVRHADAIYKISYEDGTIVETTWNHPFYIEGKGWVRGKNLRRGMRSVLGADSVSSVPQATVPSLRYAGYSKPHGLAIVSVEIEHHGETVYNFTVENAHTYFVSRDGILVHNENGCGTGLSSDELQRRTEAAQNAKDEKQLALIMKAKNFPDLENAAVTTLPDGTRLPFSPLTTSTGYKFGDSAVLPVRDTDGNIVYNPDTGKPIMRTVVHEGLDLQVGAKTAVPSVADGVVAYAGYSPSYGNFVVMQHSDGVKTLYAHASELLVKQGDFVPAGGIIMQSGKTGDATGPHLHFEIRNAAGVPQNPQTFNWNKGYENPQK